MPNTEIMIVSYAKDVPYLVYNLASIRKFARGFSGVTLVVPADEAAFFGGLDLTGCKLKTYQRVKDPLRWHLHAQAQKCHAEEHCPQAHFILHTDSDCVFTELVTPDDYFWNGLPIMCIEAYSRLKNSQWQRVVEDVLRCRVKYETMRRHPQVNPRTIYPLLRRYLKLIHQREFDDYVLSLKPTFPWGFTEHNVIGAFALETHPEAYHWIDLAVSLEPHSKLRQFWSYSPTDKPQSSPNDGKNFTPAEFCAQLLK